MWCIYLAIFFGLQKKIENADTEYAKDFITTQDREWLEESSEVRFE